MVIVAAIDRSKRARAVIEEAEQLAEALHEPVHLIHVLSRAEFVEMEQTAYEDTGQPIPVEEIREFAVDHAEGLSESMRVEHESVGLLGSADTKVVEYAEEVDARYIVVAPRRRSPVGKAVFGSVAQTILLEATCPVVSTIKRDE